MTTSSLTMGGPGDESSIDVDQVMIRFLEISDTIHLVAPDDEYNIVGRSFLASLLRSCVEARRPIGLVLPAFPAKSPNMTKKVLGSLPDRGEELAFGVHEHFCRDVEKFYPPGAEMVIFSDGRVFSDLLGITSETVETYQEECHRMVRDFGYTHIRFDDLENHLVKESGTRSTNQAELISMLLGASPAVDVEAQLASDADLLKLHRSIKCFLRLDLEPCKDVLSKFPGASRKRLKELYEAKCKEVSISMLLRNMAFSKLVGKAYPDMIRISIHADTNAGPKFGICLIPDQGEPIVRYVQPWPETKSARQWTIMRALRESDAAVVAEASQLVKDMIYNEELFSYKHSWMTKDLVFLLNHAVVHARTAFTYGSERQIRRIHFN